MKLLWKVLPNESAYTFSRVGGVETRKDPKTQDSCGL
jgi:hypothetical protein